MRRRCVRRRRVGAFAKTPDRVSTPDARTGLHTRASICGGDKGDKPLSRPPSNRGHVPTSESADIRDSIAPGQSVRFAMQIPVPSGTQPGPYDLRWQFVGMPGPELRQGKATVTVSG